MQAAKEFPMYFGIVALLSVIAGCAIMWYAMQAGPNEAEQEAALLKRIGGRDR